MFLEIRPNSKKPIYEQLILEIKRGLVSGELQDGDLMPGVRVLASDLGINMHTVNKVYKHLEYEGVLVKGKGGFVINPHRLSKPDKEVESTLKEKLYELVMEKELYNVGDATLFRLMGDIQEMIINKEDSQRVS